MNGYADDDEVLANDDTDEDVVPEVLDEHSTKCCPSPESNHPFLHSNDTSDLRLIVEGKPLYVSRVVLSLVSPVLKSLLSINDHEDTIEVALPGKKYDDVVEFLSCVYPNVLKPITESNAERMLHMADEYQVSKLTEKCEDFLVKKLEELTPRPLPDQIVHSLNLSDKYCLQKLQKASFEAAAKTESELLENVQEFWDLPSVTTTSVFIRRLKLLEKFKKRVRSKINEAKTHCSLYHKGEKTSEALCYKCLANIGKTAILEMKQI